MENPSLTKQQLIEQVSALKRRIHELERSEAGLRRAKEAHIQSEERYRTLVENATDIVYVTDDKGLFTFINPAAIRLTGYEEEELIGNHFLNHIRTDMREDVLKFLTKQLEDRTPHTYCEFALLTKSGQDIWLGQHTQLILKDGRVSGFQAVARDITDRKRAEEDLYKSEARYRLLAEKATDVIWTVGMDMQLTYVNPSVTKLLGFTVEEAMARTAQQAYTPAAFEKAMQIFGDEMANEAEGNHDPDRSLILELELNCKDGRTVPVEGHFCFIRDQTGKATGILAVMRDITDRKRMEQALRESEKKYRELSIVDDLTRLYNSRHFYHQLKMEIERSARCGQPLTMLLLDIDDFKQFNDTFGHIEGDEVLVRLGQVVKRCLRQTDTAYRYGGEEFTILLPMTTTLEGTVAAERIRTEFKKEIFSPVPGQDIHMTVTIGHGQYRSREELKAFVHRVDQLMYRGKQSGKDRVCCGS